MKTKKEKEKTVLAKRIDKPKVKGSNKTLLQCTTQTPTFPIKSYGFFPLQIHQVKHRMVLLHTSFSY